MRRQEEGGWSPLGASTWGAGFSGVRGGTAPRQPPQGTHGVWPHGVSWLVGLSPRQASLGTPENTLDTDARDGGGRAVTGKLPGLSVASLKDGEGDRSG